MTRSNGRQLGLDHQVLYKDTEIIKSLEVIIIPAFAQATSSIARKSNSQVVNNEHERYGETRIAQRRKQIILTVAKTSIEVDIQRTKDMKMFLTVIKNLLIPVTYFFRSKEELHQLLTGKAFLQCPISCSTT